MPQSNPFNRSTRVNARTRRLTLMLGAPLFMSACAYTHGITPQEQAVVDQVNVDQYMPATRDMRDNIETQELFAQAAFWSHEYDLNPSDLEATLKLAAAVRKLGNPARAVEITQTSRQIHPRDPYLLAEHSAGLIADERALDAIPVLDKGLRLAPGYGRLWSLKGAALDQMEDYDAARDHYGRALQITPQDPNVLTNLGLSYALSGDLQTAETWLRRAVAISGSRPSARENLALVLQLQGRDEEAAREARLAGLSKGDRKLPPPAVPALTPRGAPAELNSRTSTSNFGSPQQGRAPSPQGYAQPAYGANAQAATSRNPAQNPVPGTFNGMPQTRLSTVNPNGQAYSSASQAARQVARGNGQMGQYESAPAGRGGYSVPMTNEQQDVLSSIRQSLKPGAVTPPGATQQPYVVGRSSAPSQAPQGYAQQGQAPYSGQSPDQYQGQYRDQYQAPSQQTAAPQPYGQHYPQAYPQTNPAQQPTENRRAARRRR